MKRNRINKGQNIGSRTDMGELIAPIVAGFAVGIAFVVIFAVSSTPPTILTSVGDWVVRENLTQRYIFSNAVYVPETSGAGGINTGSSGSDLYITWASASGVFFTTISNGTVFSPNISLTNGTITNEPVIAAHENNVYVVWTAPGRYEKISDRYSDVFFRASHDNGHTLDPTINLSDNIGDSSYQQIAASGSNVYVVWEDYAGEKRQIFLRVSNDNGNTFSSIINLSSDSGPSEAPRIAASGSNVFVVWHAVENNDRIVFKASRDNGATFGRAINLRSYETGASCCPKLAAYGNDVYVIWADSELSELFSGHYDLHFRASHNGGISFDHITALTEIARDYQIDVAGNNVYVVWTNVLPVSHNIENAEAFFTRSTNKGVTFQNPINLSNNEGPSSNQQIAVSNNEVYVAWVDHTLDYDEILFRGSNDNGASFGRVINLSNGTGISVDQHIVVTYETLYIVWKEFGDEFHEDGIYVVRRVD